MTNNFISNFTTVKLLCDGTKLVCTSVALSSSCRPTVYEETSNDDTTEVQYAGWYQLKQKHLQYTRTNKKIKYTNKDKINK